MSNTLKDYRIGCLLLALIAMVVLFIYPSKQQKMPTYNYTFIVDITRSMNATDYQQDNQAVSRLNFVKQTLRELLQKLPYASSQAPAWEFSGGSSSFPSREAGASHLGSQAGAWELA